MLLSAAPVLAGLSPAQMQSRHRVLLGDAPAAAARSFVAVQAGERPRQAPALVGDALYDGEGLQLGHTVLERDATSLGIELRLGAVVHGDAIRLAGSSASIDFGPGAAYLSHETRHWGPGWFGSLILDAAASPLATAGWRTHQRGADAPATWYVDVFIGTLDGHSMPRRPRLIGMRLEWRPTAWLTLGAARTMQWGGEGRDESLSSFGNALIGRDNTGNEGIERETEPGNQLAGFDLRFDASVGPAAVGAYAQAIGEDENNRFPSHGVALAGIDVATTLRGTSLRLITEYAHTMAGVTSGKSFPGVTYRHHIYSAGYTHRGRLLAHPVGGDAKLASVGLLLDRGTGFALLALHRGRALSQSQRFTDGDRLTGADAVFTLAASDNAAAGVSAHLWQSGGERRRWAQLWAQYSWR